MSEYKQGRKQTINGMCPLHENGDYKQSLPHHELIDSK